MAVLDNAETVAEAIRPALDKFAAAAEPTIRKVAESLYEQLLWATQDYIRENGEWNIGQEIERCRRIEHDNTQLRIRHKEMLSALIHARAALHQHYVDWDGEPEDAVPLQMARSHCDAAIAKARGEA